MPPLRVLMGRWEGGDRRGGSGGPMKCGQFAGHAGVVGWETWRYQDQTRLQHRLHRRRRCRSGYGSRAGREADLRWRRSARCETPPDAVHHRHPCEWRRGLALWVRDVSACRSGAERDQWRPERTTVVPLRRWKVVLHPLFGGVRVVILPTGMESRNYFLLLTVFLPEAYEGKRLRTEA